MRRQSAVTIEVKLYIEWFDVVSLIWFEVGIIIDDSSLIIFLCARLPAGSLYLARSASSTDSHSYHRTLSRECKRPRTSHAHFDQLTSSRTMTLKKTAKLHLWYAHVQLNLYDPCIMQFSANVALLPFYHTRTRFCYASHSNMTFK
jgi:hypothetical protein